MPLAWFQRPRSVLLASAKGKFLPIVWEQNYAREERFDGETRIDESYPPHGMAMLLFFPMVEEESGEAEGESTLVRSAKPMIAKVAR